LREEHRLRVFQNWMMRKLFDLYSAILFRVMKPREMRWAGHVSSMGDRRSVYRILVGRLEGKSPL
jgi:hypothetical protein